MDIYTILPIFKFCPKGMDPDKYVEYLKNEDYLEQYKTFIAEYSNNKVSVEVLCSRENNIIKAHLVKLVEDPDEYILDGEYFVFDSDDEANRWFLKSEILYGG